MVSSKLSDHGGINAKVVAHLDMGQVAPWSTDAFSAPRLSEIRDLAQTLDVHRAIIAPGWGADADASETLNLVRTLKAVGVRVSVLPRMLEVVGSSVEFDDLHGVTLMGVRRFDLTRSSAALKRAFDLLGASIGLLAISPLMIAFAIAIKLDSRGPVFFRQLRVGRHGRRFYMLKFRTMVPDAEAMKESLRHRNEAQEGLFKIAEDPRVTRVGRFLRRTALDELPQLLQHRQGRDEPRRPAPAGDRGGRAHRGLAPPPSGADARHDRSVADPRPGASAAEGDGGDRLPVRRQLVALDRREDPAAHRAARPGTPRPIGLAGFGRPSPERVCALAGARSRVLWGTLAS